MKLLRTIRLDPSDTYVFEKAAEPGEWAVAGSFVFWGTDAGKLDGKRRAAFRGGLLGVDTLGWSTLAQIVEASAADRAALVEILAARLVEKFGAPDRASALLSAEDEVKFTESLASEPVDTLIAVHRSYEDGDIREAFRTLKPRPGQTEKPFRVFNMVEAEDEPERPEDKVDLISLTGRNGQ